MRDLAGFPADRLDDVKLVVSELLANAMRYAPVVEGASVRLVILKSSLGLRIEVHDPGRGFDPTPDPARPGGLGLAIVAQLARFWGIDGGVHTVVRCVLDTR